MIKQKKNIFGKEHEMTYNSETGLIESESTYSRTFLNLAIKISRIFVRSPRAKNPVINEAETKTDL